jgi:hypothetical protein
MERRMTRDELAKVDFYRGSAVQSVLRRYEFTEQEKRIIQRAITTAKKDKPNMILIDKADALLKECSATRKPKREEVEEPDSYQTAKAVADMEMRRYRRKNSSILFEPLHKPTQLLAVVIVFGGMQLIIRHYLGIDVLTDPFPRPPQTYTFEKAKEICAKQGKTLPPTAYELSYSENQDVLDGEYWLGNKQVASLEEATAWGRGHPPKKGKKYLLSCFDRKNNKDIIKP